VLLHQGYLVLHEYQLQRARSSKGFLFEWTSEVIDTVCNYVFTLHVHVLYVEKCVYSATRAF
jgi:hypothetical protein